MKRKIFSIFIAEFLKEKIKNNILNLIFLFAMLFPVYSYSQFSIGAHCGAMFGSAKFERGIPIHDDVNLKLIGSYTRGSDVDTKTTINTGAIFETRLYDFLYLQTELNYTDYRIVVNDGYTPVPLMDGWRTSTSDLSLKYIEIPLLLKIKKEYNDFVPFIYAGAGLGFLSKKEDFLYFSHFYNVSDDIKENSAYFIFGLGSEYSLNKNVNLFFTFRYSNTIKDIQTSDSYFIKPHNYDLLFGVKTILFDY
jgi:hypothetical protein